LREKSQKHSFYALVRYFALRTFSFLNEWPMKTGSFEKACAAIAAVSVFHGWQTGCLRRNQPQSDTPYEY
jgi:hypothetical protein